MSRSGRHWLRRPGPRRSPGGARGALVDDGPDAFLVGLGECVEAEVDVFHRLDDAAPLRASGERDHRACRVIPFRFLRRAVAKARGFLPQTQLADLQRDLAAAQLAAAPAVGRDLDGKFVAAEKARARAAKAPEGLLPRRTLRLRWRRQRGDTRAGSSKATSFAEVRRPRRGGGSCLGLAVLAQRGSSVALKA